ncbi:arylesterase [Sulfitobacter aestuarii]|uniref:Arylesterase n=1 Tax=Sulfitobacter aestuarii TaxID=2161676 RepID=A0ABW5U4I3_9RHOB
MRKFMLGIVIIFGQMASAEEVVIAALGDSLTQGYGLAPAEGFVPQLQGWLDAREAQVRLINAGVSGDTTAGGLARVGWTLTPEVDAMIVTLGGNDMLRGLDPAEARRNIGGILQAAETAQIEVLLIGMQAPGNYGSDYKSAFDALYPELAAQHESLYVENFFAALIEAAGSSDPSALRAYFQPDGIHPNAKGVALIVKEIGPQVLALAAAAR